MDESARNQEPKPSTQDEPIKADRMNYVMSQFDEVFEFRRSLTRETDRGCALISAAYLDDQLGQLLRSYLVDDADSAENLFDSGRDALGSFSSRIDMAYMLALIGPKARRELHLIRRIRNEFAHDPKPRSFQEQAVENRCRELRAHDVFPGDGARETYVRTSMGLLATIHAASYNLDHLIASDDVIVPPGTAEKLKSIVATVVDSIRESLESPNNMGSAQNTEQTN